MLFKKLVFNNFLVFKGENTINFPAPKPGNDSALLLIFAPNNGGKTSVIRGLEFLFYGRLRGDQDTPLAGLINSAVRNAAPANQPVTGWVQATIDVAGESRTFRRRIKATRFGANYQVETVLAETLHGPAGDTFRRDEGDIQRLLNRLVPEALFDYFYVKGEELGAKLVGNGGNNDIRDGLATLLHKNKWESAIDTVQKVRRKINEQIQKSADATAEYKEKSKRLEDVRNSIQGAHTNLAEWRKKEDEAQAEFNAAEEQIKLLGTGTPHANLDSDLAEKRKKIREAESNLTRAQNEICNLVATTKGLPFYKKAFAPGLKILGAMKQDNILPADVSDGFVNRLLVGKHCICGRPLSPESQFRTERKFIQDYRARTLAVDLSSGLLTLLNSLDGGTLQSFESTITKIESEGKDLISRRKAAILAQHDLEEAIKELEDKRAKSNIDAIAQSQTRQRIASDRRAMAKGKQGELQKQIESMQVREKEYKEEVLEMGQCGAGAEPIKLNATCDRAIELETLIEKSLELLKKSFHEVLQKSASKYYDANVTDGSKAHIDPDSLLPLIKRNGEVVNALGGGQKQLLCLAHIISLAELRRNLHARLDAIGIRTGTLDDQSFFLDSVFAPCDMEYAKVIAKFLPRKARQMVILVANQQWHETISSSLQGAIDRAYVITVHTNKKDIGPAQSNFQIGEKQFSLVKTISADQEPYSTIREAI